MDFLSTMVLGLGFLVFVLLLIVCVLSKKPKKMKGKVWFIVNPKQIMKLDVKEFASVFYGPFSKEEDARNYLEAERKHFHEKAGIISWEM